MMNNLPEKVGGRAGGGGGGGVAEGWRGEEGQNDNRNWALVFIWIKGKR